MSNLSGRFGTSIRIIGAIAAKDITDALRNKAILSMLFTALFLLVAYKGMPLIRHGDDPPRLAVYDAGNSDLVASLDESDDLALVTVDSQQEMEDYLGNENQVVLGLVLPADMDLNVEAADELRLDGYVDHWVDDAEKVEIQAFAENLLSEMTGRQVIIAIESDTVYTIPAGGHPFITSFSLTVLLTLVGISVVPHLMIEEKETKTMDSLMVSPASAGQMAIGKALTGLLYCLAIAAIVLALNANLVVYWGVAVIASIAGSLFVVALGLLMGAGFRLKQQLNLWTFVILQPLLIPVVLSEISLIPEGIRGAISWIPTVALAEIVRLALSKAAPLEEVGPKLAFVVGSAAVVLFLAARVVRRADR
jgi:ABC-2 type transport system permease protein